MQGKNDAIKMGCSRGILRPSETSWLRTTSVHELRSFWLAGEIVRFLKVQKCTLMPFYWFRKNGCTLQTITKNVPIVADKTNWKLLQYFDCCRFMRILSFLLFRRNLVFQPQKQHELQKCWHSTNPFLHCRSCEIFSHHTNHASDFFFQKFLDVFHFDQWIIFCLLY